ncbi:jg2513 [Pararge aegeria aegeria]|uniref:Jg2513 protein n=1 Tax=Pararge aegeria aegeria TaxID=348720 RepID=A0A8S4QFT0_9NEOP|nr:jg2513 [Pararge aegeria aegeria]
MTQLKASLHNCTCAVHFRAESARRARWRGGCEDCKYQKFKDIGLSMISQLHTRSAFPSYRVCLNAHWGRAGARTAEDQSPKAPPLFYCCIAEFHMRCAISSATRMCNMRADGEQVRGERGSAYPRKWSGRGGMGRVGVRGQTKRGSKRASLFQHHSGKRAKGQKFKGVTIRFFILLFCNYCVIKAY